MPICRLVHLLLLCSLLLGVGGCDGRQPSPRSRIDPPLQQPYDADAAKGHDAAQLYLAREITSALSALGSGQPADEGAKQLAQRLTGEAIAEHLGRRTGLSLNDADSDWRFVRAFQETLRGSLAKNGQSLVSTLVAEQRLDARAVERFGAELVAGLVDQAVAEAKRQPLGFLQNLEVEYSLAEDGPEVAVVTTQALYESDDQRHNALSQFGYTRRDDRNTFNAGVAYRHYDPERGYLAGVNTFLDYEAPYDHLRASVGGELKTEFLGLSTNLYKGLTGWRSTSPYEEEKAEDGADLELAARLPAIPEVELAVRGYHFRGNEGGRDTTGLDGRVEYTPVDPITLSAFVDKNNRDGPSAGVAVRYNHRFGNAAEKQNGWSKRYVPPSLQERRFEKVRRENWIRKTTRRRDGAASEDDVLNVLVVGQSNAERWFTRFSGAGEASFIATASAYYSGVELVNGALGAAAVDFRADTGAGAYLDASNTGKGAVYTTVLEPAVAASGIAPDAIDEIYLLIGETDAVAVQNGTITEADHKSAYLTLVNLLRSDFPTARVIHLPLMRDQNGLEFAGWGAVRRAQWELTRDNAFLDEGPVAYDVSFEDDLHPDAAGYTELARRAALAGLAHAGKIGASGVFGPRIEAASFNAASNLIYLDVNHDAGTDFTLVGDTRGYVFDVNGVLYNAAFVTREDADTVRSRPQGYTLQPGDTVRVLFPWGTLRNVVTSDILLDNAVDSRPLREQFDLLATEIP